MRRPRRGGWVPLLPLPWRMAVMAVIPITPVLLGVDYLSALGVGLELDSSKYPIFVTRTRLMLRYLFSPYAHGTSVGAGPPAGPHFGAACAGAGTASAPPSRAVTAAPERTDLIRCPARTRPVVAPGRKLSRTR